MIIVQTRAAAVRPDEQTPAEMADRAAELARAAALSGHLNRSGQPCRARRRADGTCPEHDKAPS